jgi:hypothetical protein
MWDLLDDNLCTVGKYDTPSNLFNNRYIDVLLAISLLMENSI